MKAPHPIPYQGSKRNLASAILRYFPESIDRLHEPFAGGGAVSIASALYGKVDRIVMNDVNSPLMELWRNIINSPDKTAKAYQARWENQLGKEREFYDFVRRRFNTCKCPEDLLYLLLRCVKAAVRYNSNGEFNQSVVDPVFWTKKDPFLR